MRHMLAMVLIAVTGLACHRPTESTDVVSSREYEVYRFLVTSLDDSTQFAAVVVIDSTVSPRVHREGNSSPLRDSMVVRFPSYFETREFQPSKILIDSLRLPSRVRSGFLNWHKRMPSADSALYVQGKLLGLFFSRVVFDSTGNEALLGVSLSSLRYGEGRWYWLTRSGTGWTIYRWGRTWIT